MTQGLDKCWTTVRRATLSSTRKSAVFVGHVLSSDGIKPDPQKVEAIIAMQTLAKPKDLQKFLGIITYLSKFIPNMSQKSALFYHLLQKDAKWSWRKGEDDAFTGLKAAISSAPVVKFFDSKEPVTLSVDEGSKGLGAIVLQNDRSMAYASKALTLSQQNYAKLKKRDARNIVFGCKRFHDYLYAHREVTVETDHKPLQTILKIPIHQAPLHLQKMILRTKCYSLNVS